MSINDEIKQLKDLAEKAVEGIIDIRSTVDYSIAANPTTVLAIIEQLEICEEALEGLLNIEGLVWMNQRQTNLAVAKARAALEWMRE